jgi:DNA-directed RNA polymerase II subunit RPB1
MAGHSSIQVVGFWLSADEEHLRDSYAEIVNYELYAPSTGEPVPGGVYDLRCGTTSHDFLCLTCVHGKKLCPGHRGHIRLRIAVLQPIAISEIRHWLRIVCFRCGEIVVDREKYARLPPAQRLAKAAAAADEG